MRQKSIDLPGMGHSAPIPAACRVGGILATSGVHGKDPSTNTLPAGIEDQARLCFENLRAILVEGGCDLGDVVKLTVFLTSESYREAVNVCWNQCYPDPEHRPARHAIVMPLRGGMLVQLEALAVVGDGS